MRHGLHLYGLTAVSAVAYTVRRSQLDVIVSGLVSSVAALADSNGLILPGNAKVDDTVRMLKDGSVRKGSRLLVVWHCIPFLIGVVSVSELACYDSVGFAVLDCAVE